MADPTSPPGSSGVQFVAKAYIDAGWEVVPLDKGEKRASTSWRKKVYKPSDFKAGDGIGGKCGEPSGWRVDVDLDCPEAVEVAKVLLPRTGLVHGRPGKPDSHYWFICEGIKTTQFTDIKNTSGKPGGMLVEIRSTGGYTALPPSGHPSGETLGWSIERAPMVLSPEELYSAVRDLAIATLLARHWPGPQAKHDMVGPLAGFLLQAKVEPAKVIETIRAAATVAGDSDVQDRIAFARTTVGKFTAGENVTGGPKLADHLGDELVARLRAWLKMTDVDQIEAMNQKHFWVRIGKDDVIGREDDETGIVFQRPGNLYSEYSGCKVIVGTDDKGKPKIQPLFQAWLESPQRRNYRKVVFLPPPRHAKEGDYNLWKGFAIAPAPGEWTLFATHLLESLCAGNQEHYEYLLDLVALTIQRPGEPSGVATVLRGEPGTGKGTFVRALGRIFGQHFVHLDSVKHLVGHFNSILSGKVIVFADEAFWGGDKQSTGALKRLITEPTLTIERKGIDATQEDNNIHLFMATNENWAVPAQLKERRFFCLDVSSIHREDHDFFEGIERELSDGGLAAFLHDMQLRPVDPKRIRKVPATRELRTQQVQALLPEMVWWMECLHDGQICADRPAKWGDWIKTSDVYDSYLRWCEQRKHHRPLNKIEFSRRMGKFITAMKEAKKHRFGSGVERGYLLRTLKDSRTFFDTALGTAQEWPDDSPAPSPSPILF